MPSKGADITDLMPADLRRADHANDRAVDRLYQRAAFASESDRMAHLLGMYEQQIARILAAQKQKNPVGPSQRRSKSRLIAGISIHPIFMLADYQQA